MQPLCKLRDNSIFFGFRILPSVHYFGKNPVIDGIAAYSNGITSTIHLYRSVFVEVSFMGQPSHYFMCSLVGMPKNSLIEIHVIL